MMDGWLAPSAGAAASEGGTLEMAEEIRVHPETKETGRRGGAVPAYAEHRGAFAEREQVVALGTVRWGAVWAGFVLAFGTQVLLGSLVVAILVSAGGGAINPTALGILSALVALIALFAGGWAAGRLAMAGVTGGIWHSVWLWGLVVTLGAVAAAIGAAGFLGFGPGSLLGAGRALDISAAWWSFIAVVASLIGAVAGGAIGGIREESLEEDFE